MSSILHQNVRGFASFIVPVLMLFSLNTALLFEVNTNVADAFFGQNQVLSAQKIQSNANFYKKQPNNGVFEEVCEELEIEDDNENDSHSKACIPSICFRLFSAQRAPSKIVLEVQFAAPRSPKTALYILYSAMKIPFFC